MTYITKAEVEEIKSTNDLELMKKYCDEDKMNNFIHLEYAKMLIKNSKYADAKIILKELLTTDYEYKARYELGKIALSNNDYDLARQHFYYVENHDDSPYIISKARFGIAKLELECKKLKTSKKYFEKLIGTSYNETARLNLGRICYQLEEYEESKYYLKGLLDSKYDYVARFDLAKTEYALGNVDVARYYFETSIEKGNQSSIYELGKLEFNEFNYKEAEKLFENCKYAGLYLAKTKYLLGKTEEAIEEFKALLYTKDDFISRVFLSIIYIKDKKYEEAFDTIYNITDYEQTDSDGRLKISLALLKELGVSLYKVFPNIENLSYSDKLWIDYDESAVLSHIITNHTNHMSKNNFSENIDVFNLFHNVNKNLTENTKTPTLNFNDTYHIDYPNVGSNGESILRVVTLPGTKEIITMFPVFSNRDDVNEETEDIDYNIRTSMLLKKIANLYSLSQTNDFDYADALSSSEKELLSEIFAIKKEKSKALTK